MLEVRAPNYWSKEDKVMCFLAGGLQKCNWHSSVFNYLASLETDDLVIFNPKRDDFDIHNPEMEVEQITWEYHHLNDFRENPKFFFSMYFDQSESVQPICFYELGRMLALLNPSRCVVSVHPGFSRKNDVIIQTALATNNKVRVEQAFPTVHAARIYAKYQELK